MHVKFFHILLTNLQNALKTYIVRKKGRRENMKRQVFM